MGLIAKLMYYMTALGAMALPVAAVAHAEVSPDCIKQASALANKAPAFWISGTASVCGYAYVLRQDSHNRVMCRLPLSYGKDCFFTGLPKEDAELVHLQRDGKEVEVKDVDAINPSTGGIYILFLPDSLYILNFDENRHSRYLKRK